MALHHQLPIYKDVYALLSLATDVTQNIPRAFKRQFSEKVISECTDMTVLILRANVVSHKAPHIDELLERIQITEVMFRIFVDKRWISKPQYASAIALTSSIGKQAGGWRKSTAASPDSVPSRRV